MSCKDLEEAFQITILLSPSKDGILFLEPIYINELEYKSLISSSRLIGKTKNGKISYGNTDDNGVQLVSTFSDINMFNSIMDNLGLLLYGLINEGLVMDGKIPKPREDLLQSLNSMKAYIDKRIKKVPNISKYFPEGTVVYLEELKKGTKLFDIHSVNKLNLKESADD